MVGTPPPAGRRPVRPGQDQGRGRRPAGRVGADRQPLACPLVRGGATGMRTARHGKPPRLGPAELARIRRVLDRGPVAAGFDNDLWTLARIAEVIERTTGVAHHPGHVWRILRAMRWSLQRPARKAVERDETAIARWVAQEWPRIKQTPKRAKPGSALSTSRASS
jgi:transposase